MARPALGHDLHDVRDHVAGALEEHRVADADVLPLDLIHVVERRVAHRDAADRHGLELRDGREHAGASDGGKDVHDARRRLARLELPRDGPARRARDLTEPTLQREIVHLDHDAVDLVGERVALALELGIEGAGGRHGVEHAAVRHGLEAPVLEGIEHRPEGRELRAAHLAHAVTDEVERPGRGDARIELLQRPGGGVPRVREHRLARLLALPVQPAEHLDRQVHFAADLEQLGDRVRTAVEPERYTPNRADVRRDVLADDAVAARRTGGEHPVLVDELDGDPVDLRLADVLDPLAVQEFPDARVELRHLLRRRDVAER